MPEPPPIRPAGSDAERRFAVAAAAALRARGRTAQLRTFWLRPNWPLAQTLNLALGVAGSLVAVSAPQVGAALLGACALSLIADWAIELSPGRLLCPERASQNVVGPAPGPEAVGRQEPPGVTLVLTACTDSPRTGVATGAVARRAAAVIARASRSAAPGWLGVLLIVVVWALAVALARVQGGSGTLVTVLALIPTVAMVTAAALLLELSLTTYLPDPQDGDPDAAIDAVLAVARALDAAPPTHLAPTVVLSGAGSGYGSGLRRYVRALRGSHTAATVVVIGFDGDAGRGWLRSDGPLQPLGMFAALRALADRVAAANPELGLRERRGRGCGAALPARMRRLPAIGLHGDAAGMTQAALLLVDEIDLYVAELRAKGLRRS